MRLGAVSYFNTLPLIHFLERRPLLAPPAELDRLLCLGELDIATAPIVTLFEHPEFFLVPGISIATQGEVKSVKLIFNKKGMTTGDIRSIYLDTESKTSILLLKVLLNKKFKRNLDDIQFTQTHTDTDAQLLIGNKAMDPKYDKKPSLDLGKEWNDWTSLPFVFAAWIGRKSEHSFATVKLLQEARNKGVQNIKQVVKENNLPHAEAVTQYLTKNISYALGEPELDSLQRFHSYCRELGLTHHDLRLNFF